MKEKKVSKEELIKVLERLPDNTTVDVFSDKKWTYPLNLPTQLRDQNNCTMLDVMFKIEKKEGIVIHIPNHLYEEL